MATRRRTYGTGSIYQRASDGLWVGTLEAGFTSAGRRRRIQVSAKTRAGCASKLQARSLEIAREGVPPEGSRAGTSVKDWLDQWLADRDVRSNSYNADRWATRQIIPVIGHKRIASLAPADVIAVQRAITSAGLAPSSAVRAHRVLMKALKDASLAGLSVPARALAAPGPGEGESDREAIPLLPAIRLTQLILTRPDATRWMAALLQAMRQGECLGLEWSQVDLDAQVIRVRWQLGRLLSDGQGGYRHRQGDTIRQLDGAIHLVPVKTSSGKRDIPLVPWMMRGLTEWRERCPESPHGLVWPRPDGGPRSDKDDREEWYALQQEAGVPPHPAGRPYYLHEARHTTVSLLVEAGVPREVIETIVGQAELVRGYVHPSDTSTRAALEQIATTLQIEA